MFDLVKFSYLKRNTKFFLILNFLFLNFTINISKAEDQAFITNNKNQISVDFLDSRNELDDYIIDSGDVINLRFFPAVELGGFYPVNEEGEIFLPELDNTFVRGLTISDLETLLEKRYEEFLIDPKIRADIALFKPLNISVQGEIRNPGVYEFPSYQSNALAFQNQRQALPSVSSELKNNEISAQQEFIFKREKANITTISKAIRKAGGITSLTDFSRVEVIRNIPISKGGGKKIAIIDFSSYIYEEDSSNDLRLYDGDRLFFPKLSSISLEQIPKSILSGVSPRFIKVSIRGQVDNPGIVQLPYESVLSDVIDVTGPIKPLSGKIILIRYNLDGTILKKKISYSANAKRGSKSNPYLKENDILAVQNSVLGRSTAVIQKVTAPFFGIYAAKELFEDFSE